MSETTTKQRFLICYKKKITNMETSEKELTKFIKTFKSLNQIECCKSVSRTLKIPNEFIGRYDNKEGIIYCNEIYNPADKEGEL